MFEQLRESRRREQERRRQEEEQEQLEEQQERMRKKREEDDLERAVAETILTISAESWARMRSKKLVKYDAFCVDASADTVDEEIPAYEKCKHRLYQQAQKLGAAVVVDVHPTITRVIGPRTGRKYNSAYLIGTALVPKSKPTS